MDLAIGWCQQLLQHERVVSLQTNIFLVWKYSSGFLNHGAANKTHTTKWSSSCKDKVGHKMGDAGVMKTDGSSASVDPSRSFSAKYWRLCVVLTWGVCSASAQTRGYIHSWATTEMAFICSLNYAQAKWGCCVGLWVKQTAQTYRNWSDNKLGQTLGSAEVVDLKEFMADH